jgi:hypothetical protein
MAQLITEKQKQAGIDLACDVLRTNSVFQIGEPSVGTVTESGKADVTIYYESNTRKVDIHHYIDTDQPIAGIVCGT